MDMLVQKVSVKGICDGLVYRNDLKSYTFFVHRNVDRAFFRSIKSRLKITNFQKMYVLFNMVFLLNFENIFRHLLVLHKNKNKDHLLIKFEHSRHLFYYRWIFWKICRKEIIVNQNYHSERKVDVESWFFLSIAMWSLCKLCC